MRVAIIGIGYRFANIAQHLLDQPLIVCKRAYRSVRSPAAEEKGYRHGDMNVCRRIVRCTKWAASRRRSCSCCLPVNSSGKVLKSLSRKVRSERNASSFPLWGVAVTRIRCRVLSARCLNQLIALVPPPDPLQQRRRYALHLQSPVRDRYAEFVAAAFRLDKVRRDDHVRIALKHRFSRVAIAF